MSQICGFSKHGYKIKHSDEIIWLFQKSHTASKVSKYGVFFFCPYFLVFGLNTEIVFSPNTEKWGPEKTPYLDTCSVRKFSEWVSRCLHHCVKSVRSRGYSCPHFPYSVRIRENADQDNSECGHFLCSTCYWESGLKQMFWLYLIGSEIGVFTRPFLNFHNQSVLDSIYVVAFIFIYLN